MPFKKVLRLIDNKENERAKSEFFKLNLSNASSMDSAYYYYCLGNILNFENKYDQSIENLQQAKVLFLNINDIDKVQDINLKIFQNLNAADNKTVNKYHYLNSYIEYANQSKDPEKIANAYFNAGKSFLNKDERKSLYYYKIALLQNLKTNNTVFNARIHHNMAVVFAGDINELDSAVFHYNIALPIFKKFHLSDYEAYVCNNLGIVYTKKKQFRLALLYFKKADSIPLKMHKNQTKLQLYGFMVDMFKAQKDYKNTTLYSDKEKYYEKLVKQEEQNIAIHEIDSRYQTHEKDLAIKTLTSKQILLFVLINIIFFIALYAFIRWKKVDARRKKLVIENQYLENQHTKTVEELKNVKKLIEKESVILKDKTKVNLEQLAYIKADDHYLSIHTIEKKNHFVRGKLSEIIEELPPNFIKCHRSYIINKNHIKQIQSKFIIMNDNSEIPISRGFKI